MKEQLQEIVKSYAAPASSWTLFGISFAHVNDVLQALTLLSATACSIISIIDTFRRRRKKKNNDESRHDP